MIEGDFPALFQDADSAAKRTQGYFFLSTVVVSLASLAAGILSNFADEFTAAKFLSVFFSISALMSAVVLMFLRPQRAWYASRALAESVKTVSWRYICRAEPYHGATTSADERLKKTIRSLMEANSHAPLRYSSSHTDLVTNRMIEIRDLPLKDRIDIYIEHRIENQLTWYRNGAALNSKRSVAWHSALIISTLLALSISIAGYDSSYFTYISWLYSIPLAILAWIQTKRYQELAESYALTAHEITAAKGNVRTISSESDFSGFVGDMENAFSREHTQWSARKDIP